MKYLVCLLGACLLWGCRPEPKLEGTTFTLSDSPVPVTLTFDAHGNRYFGQAVNRYFGTYTRQESALNLTVPYSTMWAGDNEDMMWEETYLDALAHVVSYTQDEASLTLTLSDGRRLNFKTVKE